MGRDPEAERLTPSGVGFREESLYTGSCRTRRSSPGDRRGGFQRGDGTLRPQRVTGVREELAQVVMGTADLSWQLLRRDIIRSLSVSGGKWLDIG